jgi:hypothetical protein
MVSLVASARSSTATIAILQHGRVGVDGGDGLRVQLG